MDCIPRNKGHLDVIPGASGVFNNQEFGFTKVDLGSWKHPAWHGKYFWGKNNGNYQCFQWKTCVPLKIHLNNWLVFDEFHADCHDLLQSLHPAHSISIIIADNLMDLVHRLGSHRKDEPEGFPAKTQIMKGPKGSKRSAMLRKHPSFLGCMPQTFVGVFVRYCWFPSYAWYSYTWAWEPCYFGEHQIAGKYVLVSSSPQNMV